MYTFVFVLSKDQMPLNMALRQVAVPLLIVHQALHKYIAQRSNDLAADLILFRRCFVAKNSWAIEF